MTVIAASWSTLDRDAGLLALALLTVVVLVAIVRGGALPRTLALLTVAFAAVHVAGAVADRAFDVGPIDAGVPFGAGSGAFWTGLGALALDLAVAGLITVALRGRISERGWSALRWLAYACWALALVHAVGIGTDLEGRWALAVVSGGVGLVAAALAWRASRTRVPEPAPRPEPPRPPVAVAPEPAREPVSAPEAARRHVAPSPLWSSGGPPERP